MDKLDCLINEINKFVFDRDWDKFHTPSNLAKSISIESNELLECFQWDDKNFDIEHVKEELADVLTYCIQLSEKLRLDIKEIVLNKMEKNKLKYPVDKCKGKADKYDKY